MYSFTTASSFGATSQVGLSQNSTVTYPSYPCAARYSSHSRERDEP